MRDALIGASDRQFELFGEAHLATLAVLVVLAVVIARTARGPAGAWLAWSLAALLLVQAAAKFWGTVVVLDYPWQSNLPLDLCRLNELLCVVMLTARSYRIFEVAYFWAMGGSVAAMLTPDLASPFPSLFYVFFFLGHGLVVLAVVYAIFGFGWRIRLRSLGIALAVTAVYAVAMAGANHLLDANYLFLREKPAQASVLDLFGPWPQYLFALMGLAVVVCWLCYLPFALARRLEARRR